MIIQQAGRTANAAIARRVGLTPSAVLERLRKLERKGVIRGYAGRLDAAAVGLGLSAFVTIRTEEALRDHRIGRAIARIPEVLELHDVAGQDCYLARIVARDMAHLHELVRGKLGAIRGIRTTTTTIVMQTLKEGAPLPIKRVEKGATP